MKKRLLVLLLAVLSLLGGCAHNEDEIVIGCCMSNMSEEYMIQLESGLRYEATKYDQLRLVIVDGELRTDKQAFQVENFIAQDVDAIIMCPVDGDALAPAVKEAVTANIPVFTVANDVNDDVGQISILADDVSGARDEMIFAVRKIGEKGKIAILLGPLGAFAAEQRHKGYEQVLVQYPDVEVVAEQTANWQRDEAMRLVENWLNSGMEINAIVSENDGMAMGALEAIRAAGKLDEIIVTGYDGVKDALYSIEKNELDATGFQDALEQAKQALELAVRAARGEKVHGVYIPVPLVTKDNVQDMLKRITLPNE